MKTIAFSSMKGGVGKSTASIFVANNLAARGFKVLFFDLDTNNSGSMYYTIGIDNIQELQQVKNTFEALSHNNIADYNEASILSFMENPKSDRHVSVGDTL